MKLWEGRFSKEADKITNDFNSSINTDKRMFREDIDGSIAHAHMLGETGIISKDDENAIVNGLKEIKSDIENGSLTIDPEAEDIHTFVEGELTKRVGDAGKRLHTARSRNDQVALDLRLNLIKECDNIDSLLKKLILTLADSGEKYKDYVMPGYTHLQRAQGVTFGHYMLAYAEMFLRDRERLSDCKKRTSVSPLGSCALAGTTYNTDRHIAANLLGLSDICRNSLDGVSDRDFVMELCSCLSIIAVHLSRFSEEIVLWCSYEFKFIELDDAFSTGSSIMPQKKNPDIAELVRGKSGRVFGDNMNILTIMKGLPLAYDKDLQEDKDCVFDAVDTVKSCLTAFIPMIETMTVNKENLRNAALKGFINATDCADYLVGRGMPFRDAYKITGSIVSFSIKNNFDLETLPLNVYKEFSDLFESDVYDAVNIDRSVALRDSEGGPSPLNVKKEAIYIKSLIENDG